MHVSIILPLCLENNLQKGELLPDQDLNRHRFRNRTRSTQPYGAVGKNGIRETRFFAHDVDLSPLYLLAMRC
jgi:hypothetical protein